MKSYSSNLFMWNHSQSRASADCSDLGILATDHNPANFAVISSVTGVRREFFRKSASHQDMQAYVTFDKQPLLTIVLYND